MNEFDKVYLNLLQDVIDNGVEKKTRSGHVKSVFGRQLRFDLKKGIPILTTKKVFSKGVIHELLWFLNHYKDSYGGMNINYLLRNNVHIWDDDAYRWYKETMKDIFKDVDEKNVTLNYFVVMDDDEKGGKKEKYQYWLENEIYRDNVEHLRNLSKEEFIDMCLQNIEVRINTDPLPQKYRFGELGPIYGKQWRSFGFYGIDQIENIIKTLKKKPNDRRMLCVAYNPDQLDEMALPPCHVMMQFYTRKLTWDERLAEYKKRYGRTDGPITTIKMDDLKVPKYGLSCMWTQRSVDSPIGLPYNILSYSILTYMIAELVNMVPDELIGSLGDTHVYMNQMDGVKEQLSRNGSDIYPQLKITGTHKKIEDFKFDDFEITDYHPDPTIKFPLSVG